ncbi:MAG: hypothetical protein J2P49_11115, partial [Methylocapsa sp.]|nr:hypothetical protein [Methylocapsa sp.]
TSIRDPRNIMGCKIRRKGHGNISKTWPRICCREIDALERQGRVQGLCKRIGGAIREIEPRFCVNAFAVAVESGGSGPACTRMYGANLACPRFLSW